MKAKPALLLLMIFLLLAVKANTNQDQQEIDSDFLEFLADMEEVTGDGFENWLEAETETDINSEIDSSYTKEQ